MNANGTKFTPGPWKLSDRLDMRGKPCGYEIWRGSARGPGCGACNVISYSPDGRTPQNKANMALIAAAPDLYAALRECLAVVALQNGNLHDDINAIQKRASAALAKAEGRADQ